MSKHPIELPENRLFFNSVMELLKRNYPVERFPDSEEIHVLCALFAECHQIAMEDIAGVTSEMTISGLLATVANGHDIQQRAIWSIYMFGWASALYHTGYYSKG